MHINFVKRRWKFPIKLLVTFKVSSLIYFPNSIRRNAIARGSLTKKVELSEKRSWSEVVSPIDGEKLKPVFLLNIGRLDLLRNWLRCESKEETKKRRETNCDPRKLSLNQPKPRIKSLLRRIWRAVEIVFHLSRFYCQFHHELLNCHFYGKFFLVLYFFLILPDLSCETFLSTKI